MHVERGMAWRASRGADQSKKFVTQYESGHWAMAELCRMYDISRQSGYKWVKRGQQGEVEWEDRSRAAHHHPLQMAAEIEEKILACRYQHPTWGARKLRKFLSDRDQKARWPALSTIGEVLKRSGLSNPSRSGALHRLIPNLFSRSPKPIRCGAPISR